MTRLTYSTENLCFAYSSTDILRSLNLTFEPGLFHAIVGPNGSGKSTLLDTLAGHKTPASGEVRINDTSVNSYSQGELARLIASVPQEFSFNFPFTVFDAVLMGRHPHIPRFSRPSDLDLAKVHSAMQYMDIGHLAERTLTELSGGEKQRTVFARALAQDTPGLLLDEPTSSMDIRHALAAMKQLGKLAHEEDRTVITVLHDLNMAAAYCDRIVVLQDGRIHIQGSPADALTPDTIRNVFGVSATVVSHPEDDRFVITFESKD